MQVTQMAADSDISKCIGIVYYKHFTLLPAHAFSITMPHSISEAVHNISGSLINLIYLHSMYPKQANTFGYRTVIINYYVL
jgi:hypothetical protein